VFICGYFPPFTFRPALLKLHVLNDAAIWKNLNSPGRLF